MPDPVPNSQLPIYRLPRYRTQGTGGAFGRWVGSKPSRPAPEKPLAEILIGQPDLPPICAGDECRLGSDTKPSCSKRCRLMARADKPEPELPKPPSS